ncbi:unnamed protein product [Diamesa hyperborea]
MVIYTNEGNPLALNLLVCTNFAKKGNVEIKYVNLSDPDLKEPKHLPTLVTESGSRFFMTSAAVQYICAEIEDESDIKSQWLEWSTTRLAPALVQNMAIGPRVDPKAKVTFTGLINVLEDALKKTIFLCGGTANSSDIAVWSLLAPEDSLKGCVNIDNVLRWYRTMSNYQEVKDALLVIPLKSLNYNSMLQANRFSGLNQEVATNMSEVKFKPEPTAAVADIITPEELEMAKESFIFVPPVKKDDPKIILPKAGQRNVLITSALPYVNNVPHLGNIIGCVLSADIFARYSRLCGYNTLYVSGTDEYGTATETKALAEKLTPKQICDKYFEIHNSIYRWFGIGFDYFGRTTTPEQTEIVQEMFLDLHKAGFIETQVVEQLLCQKCDRFLADRFVEGTCPQPGCGYEDARGDQCDGCGKLVNAIELINPRCKECNSSPVTRQSNQLFIDLPKIEPKLREWIETVDHLWTNNARVITKAWLKEGLRSRCITRDLKWGIPVPLAGFESKVFYVWFDAPLGYMSITSRYTKEWRQWWQPTNPEAKVELFMFMAKDNVPFHSVMFPSTLLGVNKGHTLASRIMATEYLNYEDGKFSKSRGVGVFGNDAQATGIDADVWRFYLASARPEGQDSSFSWNDLAARNNSELLNNLGNFCNRALVFCEKNFNSTIALITLNADDLNLVALVNRELKGYINSMEKSRFREAIRHLLSVSRHGNLYMQTEQPWVQLKGTDDQKARAGSVISLSCNIACLLATMLFPFMPDTARKLYKQLNVSGLDIDPSKPQMTLFMQNGHKINKPIPLFTKIEQAQIDDMKKKYGGVQQPAGKAKPEKSNKLFTSVDEAERAIADQGEKVRKLKTSGVEKAVWQPEVTILLELKKQLTALQTPKAAGPVAAVVDVKALEAKVAEQGEKVRKLKTSGVEKSVWQPEVAILLELKKQLTAAQAPTAVAPVKVETKPVASEQDVKAVEAEVAQQGEKVRLLKTGGAEKSVWQPEVEKLLALKAKLTALTGKPAAAPASSKKKK